MIFRRPLVFVNVLRQYDIRYCQYSPGTVMFKKFYSEAVNRYLTFSEVFSHGLANTNTKASDQKQIFDNLKLTVEENSPQEICEAAIEMHLSLNSELVLTEEDHKLQARFLSIMRSHADGIPEYSKAPDPTASTHFLRTNRDLLT